MANLTVPLQEGVYSGTNIVFAGIPDLASGYLGVDASTPTLDVLGGEAYTTLENTGVDMAILGWTYTGVNAVLAARDVGDILSIATVGARRVRSLLSDGGGSNNNVVPANISQGETSDFYQTNPDGSYYWPDNLGFSGEPESNIIDTGTFLDRYGDNDGSFLSPRGISFDERALGPGNGNRTYREYEVLRPLPVIDGEVAEAFGKVDGGTQMLPEFPENVNIDWLIDNRYLKELE